MQVVLPVLVASCVHRHKWEVAGLCRVLPSGWGRSGESKQVLQILFS